MSIPHVRAATLARHLGANIHDIPPDDLAKAIVLAAAMASHPDHRWEDEQRAMEIPAPLYKLSVSLAATDLESKQKGNGPSHAHHDDEANDDIEHHPNANITWLADTIRQDIPLPDLELAWKRGSEGFTQSELRKTLADSARFNGGIVPQHVPTSAKSARVHLSQGEVFDLMKSLDAAGGLAIQAMTDENAEEAGPKCLALIQHLLFQCRNWQLRSCTSGGSYLPASAQGLITPEVHANVRNRAAVQRVIRRPGQGRGSGGRGRGDRGRGGGGRRSNNPNISHTSLHPPRGSSPLRYTRTCATGQQFSGSSDALDRDEGQEAGAEATEAEGEAVDVATTPTSAIRPNPATAISPIRATLSSNRHNHVPPP